MVTLLTLFEAGSGSFDHFFLPTRPLVFVPGGDHAFRELEGHASIAPVIGGGEELDVFQAVAHDLVECQPYRGRGLGDEVCEVDDRFSVITSAAALRASSGSFEIALMFFSCRRVA